MHFALFMTWVLVPKRIEIEDLLPQSEEKLRYLLEHAVDAFFIVDQQGRFIDINQRACESLRYTRRELLGLSVSDIVVMPDLAKASKEVWEELSSYPSLGYHRRKDGTVFPVETKISLVELEGDQMLFYLARDVTERKETEDALKEAALLPELNPDPVIRFNEKGTILSSNPAAEQILGKKARKGSQLKGFLSGITRVRLEQCIQKGLKIVHEESIGCRHFRFVICGIPEFGVGYVYGSDITDMKEVDKIKTEFISITSHQLRTPLAGIKLFLEMLLKERAGQLNDQQREYVQHVFSSTERMIKLVNELLNVSRLETGKLDTSIERVQLKHIIQDTINENKVVIGERKGTLVFQKPRRILPKVSTDATLIRQILHNLIANSLQYSPMKHPRIVVRLEYSDDSFLMSVQDNGVGILEQDQSRVFEKFFRTESGRKLHSEGSGLGLYTIKMIVNTLGGEVWLESKVGKGTTFYIRMPLKQRRLHNKEKA